MATQSVPPDFEDRQAGNDLNNMMLTALRLSGNLPVERPAGKSRNKQKIWRRGSNAKWWCDDDTSRRIPAGYLSSRFSSGYNYHIEDSSWLRFFCGHCHIHLPKPAVGSHFWSSSSGWRGIKEEPVWSVWSRRLFWRCQTRSNEVQEHCRRKFISKEMLSVDANALFLVMLVSFVRGQTYYVFF